MDPTSFDAIDLSGAVPVDTIEYEILKPGGTDGTGWVWQICGPAHPKAVAHTEAAQRKNLRKQRQIEQAQANGRKYVAEERTVEDQRRDNVAWIVSRVTGWNRPVTLNQISPNPINYSDQAVADILIRPEMAWLYNQLVDVVTEEKSFTNASAKT